MSRDRCAVVLVLLLAPLGVQAQESSGAQGLEAARRQQVREATRDLAREIAYLQEDIASDLVGSQARLLYREANSVLTEIAEFQTSLTSPVSTAVLNRTSDSLERKVRDLVQLVKRLGPEYRLLQRDAVRVTEASDALHQTVFRLETTGTRTRDVLTREARRLAVAARQFDTMAGSLLDPQPARQTLLAEIENLTTTTELFVSHEPQMRDLEQLKRLFRPVNAAWKRVALGLRELPPLERALLLRTASRVNELEDQVRELLGIQKDLPCLVP